MDMIIDSLDFSKINTLCTTEKCNIDEWQKSYLLPILSLRKDSKYTVSYIRFKANRWYGNVFSGNSDEICNRLKKRSDECDKIILFISNKKNSQNNWLIIRL
ncbi:MAG: hypothetical protein RR144_05735 [Clostridia bacterium]